MASVFKTLCQGTKLTSLFICPGVPQVCERAPREVKTVFHTAEKVRRLIECPVSPHLTNCTCGSRTDQQATKPQSLSLRVWFYSLGFVQTGSKHQNFFLSFFFFYNLTITPTYKLDPNHTHMWFKIQLKSYFFASQFELCDQISQFLIEIIFHYLQNFDVAKPIIIFILWLIL